MKRRIYRKIPNINLLKPRYREGLAGRWSWGGFGRSGVGALYDDTINGNTGNAGTGVSWGAGRFAGERSPQYNGSSTARISIGTDVVNFNHNGDFTAMAWVYIESLAAQRALISEDDASNSKKWSLRINTTGYFSYQQYSGTTSTVRTSTSHPVPAGMWTHVAVGREGSVLKGWVNGEKISWNSDVATSGGQGSPSLRFGVYRVSSSPMLGNMTDVRIYSKAMKDADVRAIAKGHDMVQTFNGFDGANTVSAPAGFVRSYGTIF